MSKIEERASWKMKSPLFICLLFLVCNVLSSPSPKKKKIFDKEFLKTGVSKDARCKSDQSTLLKERDELLEKVKAVQDKLNALTCTQEQVGEVGPSTDKPTDTGKSIGKSHSGQSICELLRTVLSEVNDKYIMWVMVEHYNQFAFCSN